MNHTDEETGYDRCQYCTECPRFSRHRYLEGPPRSPHCHAQQEAPWSFDCLNQLGDFNRLITSLASYGGPVRVAFEATDNYNRTLAFIWQRPPLERRGETDACGYECAGSLRHSHPRKDRGSGASARSADRGRTTPPPLAVLSSATKRVVCIVEHRRALVVF